MIPKAVWECICDEVHPPWRYKATKRALSKYLVTSRFSLVDNNHIAEADEVIVIETSEHAALFAKQTPNKLARFSFADRYTSLGQQPGLVEIKTNVDHRRSFISEIPFPLLPDKPYSPTSLSSLNTKKRKYFATFKGRIYQSNKVGSIRSDLLKYHNNNDIIVAPLRHKYDFYNDYQEKYLGNSNQYDYIELMDTKFGLCPGGRQFSTYRLVECLRSGVVPIIYDNAKKQIFPFQDIIGWRSAVLLATPENIDDILDFAREMTDNCYEKMVLKGQQISSKYFVDFEGVASIFLESYSHYFLSG